MDDIEQNSKQINEAYLVRKYCVSRHQAERLLAQYGHDQAEIDALLGAKGRSASHRRQDMMQVSTGLVPPA